MIGAIKVLVPIGVGLAGLVAFASKANAKADMQTGPGPAKAGAQKLTTVDVADMMTKALASADPKVLLELATKLEQQGFTQQAADLRSVAATLSKVGAAAAGTTPPPLVSPGQPVTPAANIPVVSPGSSNILTPPPIQLPNMVVTAPGPGTVSGPTAAERDVAAAVVIDQQSKPKWKENRDLVSVFQAQESRAGSYKNILTGEPGKVDGLYGPGTALALAERFSMVPPPPKYWPKNPAPALSAYKARLMKLAAADPVRASEWTQAAQKAKAV